MIKNMNTQLFDLRILLLFSYFSCFLILVPVSAKVFLSIDCGSSSSQPHTDANSIEWVGDDPYVRSGETHKVEVAPSSLSTTTWDSQVMSTLRAFPTRRRNCYSIDIEDTTTAERVLVRATFYYGNYDKKANPPNFLLQFNGNNWARIETSMSGIEYKEVAYSLNNGNNINICLAQTLSSNIPFISALEVRSLDSKVYSNIGSNYPLFFMTRNAFTKTDIRFPEDSFDRIWHTTAPPTGLITVASNSPSIIVETDDKPPEAVLRAALTSTLTRNHITYSGFADPKYPVHFNAYFSEVIELSSTQKRSMDISVDNKLINSIIVPKGPVIPPYGRALEVHIPNITSAYTIAFKPTDDSTLPPLINALEGFVIGDALVQGTNSDDVKALVLLQTTYIQLQYWSGDPCLPSLLYNWEWIECSYDTDSPRVTALYLSGYELTGILPDFSGMDALETINLSNNSLTQAIPEFLGTFPKLKTLNLADNDFSGTIPSSLSNNIDLNLYVYGNSNLCTSITKLNCKADDTDPGSRIPTRNTGTGGTGKNSKTSSQPIIILLTMCFGLLF